jgi:hypothetical protein
MCGSGAASFGHPWQHCACASPREKDPGIDDAVECTVELLRTAEPKRAAALTL